jgi:hypothetical protein
MKNMWDWYWLADDGRVYGTARQLVVDTTDADYVAWTAGQTPSEWPRNETDQQTEADLQAALDPHLIYFVNLEYYTRDVRQKKYAADITVNGMPFSTDPVTVGTLNAAYIATTENPAGTYSWRLPDGTFITLDAANIKALHNALSSFEQSCFLCEDETLTGIESGTITTREQIDDAFAAVPNTFTSVLQGDLNRRHGMRR